MLRMVQPVQLCNPATVVGGQGGCSEVSVAGIVGDARGYYGWLVGLAAGWSTLRVQLVDSIQFLWSE